MTANEGGKPCNPHRNIRHNHRDFEMASRPDVRKQPDLLPTSPECPTFSSLLGFALGIVRNGADGRPETDLLISRSISKGGGRHFRSAVSRSALWLHAVAEFASRRVVRGALSYDVRRLAGAAY